MLEFLDCYNNLINLVGACISGIGLFVSIVTYRNTNSIKEDMKRKIDAASYVNYKTKLFLRLKATLKMIQEDNIYDEKELIDMLEGISTFDHFKNLQDEVTRQSVETLQNKIELALNHDIYKYKKEVVIALSKAIGQLKVEEHSLFVEERVK